jgi:DNA (cytosine-5)-methyltransferase 1
MVRLNDFFCGAGGMGLGFKQAGFDIVGAWDFDVESVRSYQHNVGNHVKLADVREMTWKDVPRAECWSYGFPCQDLSKAGRMKGLIEGERSKMFFEIMRLLDETRENEPDNLPEIIMAENVEQLRKYLPVLIEEYQKRGYRAYIQLFNSKFWDVPQNRKRFFVVGVREDLDKPFRFPEEGDQIRVTLNDIKESDVDESLYLELDYRELVHKLPAPADFLLVKEATKKGFVLAYPGDSINIAFPTSKTRRGRRGDQIAQTLLTGREQVLVEEDLRVRYFTTRETARIQGFPDTYEIIVNEGEAQKQFGNAVSVPVARNIAAAIKDYLILE